MEDFHDWASRIPHKVDRTYRSGANFIGQGSNARAIQESLTIWARGGDDLSMNAAAFKKDLLDRIERYDPETH